MTPPTRQKDFTDFSKFLRIFLKGNVTKIRVSVNQVKIYKFFQNFSRWLPCSFASESDGRHVRYQVVCLAIDTLDHLISIGVPVFHRQTLRFYYDSVAPESLRFVGNFLLAFFSLEIFLLPFFRGGGSIENSFWLQIIGTEF